ncbi:hypothetical protein tpqmel_0795, partial [Candidatus Gastranaerophilus sp. (ex Termes propinquus)]
GFQTYDELEKILLQLQNEKEKLVKSISTWNWLNYSKKHLELWNYVLHGSKKTNYTDGLNSLFEMQASELTPDKDFIYKKSKALTKAAKKHKRGFAAAEKAQRVKVPLVKNLFLKVKKLFGGK